MPSIIRGPRHDDLAREHFGIDDLSRDPIDLDEDLHVDLILYIGRGVSTPCQRSSSGSRNALS